MSNTKEPVMEEVKSPKGGAEQVDNSVNVEELLKKQAAMFEAQQKAIIEQMNEKVEALAEQNTKLNEELNNLKTNTEEENRLLGQKIANIKPEEKENTYNPYDAHIFYEVYNEEAKATTIMGGDEVECIVGNKEYITKKLKSGAKSFEKHPYKVKLIGK